MSKPIKIVFYKSQPIVYSTIEKEVKVIGKKISVGNVEKKNSKATNCRQNNKMPLKTET